MCTTKIDFKNSPKMEYCFFETEIWYAWLGLDKNWVIIIQDKKTQFYSILSTNLPKAVCKLSVPDCTLTHPGSLLWFFYVIDCVDCAIAYIIMISSNL